MRKMASSMPACAANCAWVVDTWSPDKRVLEILTINAVLINANTTTMKLIAVMMAIPCFPLTFYAPLPTKPLAKINVSLISKGYAMVRLILSQEVH
jgi:hypothetical protein